MTPRTTAQLPPMAHCRHPLWEHLTGGSPPPLLRREDALHCAAECVGACAGPGVSVRYNSTNNHEHRVAGRTCAKTKRRRSQRPPFVNRRETTNRGRQQKGSRTRGLLLPRPPFLRFPINYLPKQKRHATHTLPDRRAELKRASDTASDDPPAVWVGGSDCRAVLPN